MAQIEFILFPVILFLILPGLPAQGIESTTVVGATMTAPITVDSSVMITLMFDRETFTPLDVTSATVPTEPPVVTSHASTISTTAAPTPEKTTTVPTEKMDKTNWEATTTYVFIPVSSIDAKSTTILVPVSKVSTLDTTTPLEPTTFQDVLVTVVSLLPTTYQKPLTNDLTAWSSQTTTPSAEGSPTLLTESTTPIGMRMLTGWFSNPSTTDTSISLLDSVLIEDPLKPSLLWSIIVTTLVGVIVVAGVMCLCLLVNLRRRKGTKHFGSNLRNGHRSKRKKMAEEEAWAGPVNLGNGEGEECDGVEEGRKLEDNHREANGTEGVLSTFIANETNGGRGGPDSGVGGPGSVEAQRWEEEAALLYIDEDVKRETGATQKEEATLLLSKTNSENEKEQNGEDMKVGGTEKVAEDGKSGREGLNGGAAFCITTTV